MELYFEKYCKRYDKLESQQKLVYERNTERKVFTNKDSSSINKTDEQWEQVKKEVVERDMNTCRIYRLLSPIEKREVDSLLNGNPVLKTLDPAHIFGRGSNPELKYVKENIVSLYRLFHTRLDCYQHPITGKPITKEERIIWFEKALGESEFMKLITIKENLRS